MLSVITQSVIMLSDFMLHAMSHYTECHHAVFTLSVSMLSVVMLIDIIIHAKCHYPECHYGECRGAGRLTVVALSLSLSVNGKICSSILPPSPCAGNAH
jgi:hypothetical protein